MSLDLDIKIKKNIKLKDVLINCRSELINLTKEMNIPEIQSYVLNDGFKRFPNDEYVFLSLSKLCGSNIIDERMVWSKNRESTYNTFLEGLKNNKIICTNICPG